MSISQGASSLLRGQITHSILSWTGWLRHVLARAAPEAGQRAQQNQFREYFTQFLRLALLCHQALCLMFLCVRKIFVMTSLDLS